MSLRSHIETLLAPILRSEPPVPTAARQQEYIKLLGPEEAKLVEDTAAPGMQHYFQNAYKRILSSSPNLKDLKPAPELIFADTVAPAVANHRARSGEAIVFDSTTAIFLNTLNKAALYASEDERTWLFRNLFIHFASVISPTCRKVGFTFPRPKTPTHPDRHGMTVLTGQTLIQETFLIAHELAHVMIAKRLPLASRIHAEQESLEAKAPSFDPFPKPPFTSEECLADHIAAELVLDTFGREEGAQVRAILTCIFFAIRYYLWLSLITKEDAMQSSFHLWFYRNASFRSVIDKLYHRWGAPIFIIQLLDAMETDLEPAAMEAEGHFAKLVAELDKVAQARRSAP